jgi:hypothetical protein
MLQLPTCTAASSQEDRTIRCKWKFIFQKKKLFPSDDVNSGDNDVLLPVLSTVRQAADKLGTEVVQGMLSRRTVLSADKSGAEEVHVQVAVET